MKTKRLTQEKIEDIANDVASGLNNKDACEVNDISQVTFYRWINIAKNCDGKEELTEHEELCVNFVNSIKKAKHRRKQLRIEKLDNHDSVVGTIFLLKNEYPNEYNRQPIHIANFDKLEEYMQSEYTQAEINAVREAIFAAEDRREAEMKYDEDAIFCEDAEGVDEAHSAAEV